jgi:hypothetical protein
MNNNTWNHISWSLSKTNGWNIYLNGNLYISYTNGYYPTSNLTRTLNYIGKSNWTGDPAFEGNITDFRIYNSVLNSTEIKSIYDGNQLILSFSNPSLSPTTNGNGFLYN